ncbi:unnamed protein product [Brassica rapa]|uniref:Uncharacterized protein n=2 Tax=Brassica TaxID=3705 RepID=A0A3P5YMV1_BRACM|nr:unnamed protein product [Brassica napus]CAG7865583.1 unnamed protein product [Brassica rapa]CDY51434.1 BnaA09g54790D [Brassica napus]VDC62643.1 unnamed protein product [Brassica rapa]
MDDYTREGVLAKIRGEPRANVFVAIEDDDKVVEKL